MSDHAQFVSYLMGGGDSVRRRKTSCRATSGHRCSVASLVEDWLSQELGRRPSTEEVETIAERVRAKRPHGGKAREAAVRAECQRYCHLGTGRSS